MTTKNIFQDWHRNDKNFKGKFVLVHFRFAALVSANSILKILFFWYLIYYRFFVIWIMGIEIPASVVIGKGLQLFHGQSLVINPGTVIGENCVLRHSITIGNKSVSDGLSGCPKIGNNVDVGANCCIVGDIVIGDNVTIGVGSIVTKSFPSNCIIVGNPARILRMIEV